jgi:hypothetical protein
MDGGGGVWWRGFALGLKADNTTVWQIGKGLSSLSVAEPSRSMSVK